MPRSPKTVFAGRTQIIFFQKKNLNDYIKTCSRAEGKEQHKKIYLLSEESNEMVRYDKVFCIQPSLQIGVILVIFNLFGNIPEHILLFTFTKKGETKGLNIWRNSLFIPSSPQFMRNISWQYENIFCFQPLDIKIMICTSRSKMMAGNFVVFFLLIVSPISAK